MTSAVVITDDTHKRIDITTYMVLSQWKLKIIILSQKTDFQTENNILITEK